jgi:hypothetical protein
MSSLYTENNTITINQSVILPITSGTILVDTIESITIIMKNPENPNDILTINKIDNDNYHPIILFCDSETSNVNIDDNHIIFFGLNPSNLLQKGKNTTLVLKATSTNNWETIHEN